MPLPYRPRRLGRLLFVAASLAVALASARVVAETYPARPIDFIVPWGTGGGADYVGRALAKEMEPILGVSLPVLNVPGGTGQTGLIKLRDSKADGYTIEEVTSETVLLEVTGKPLFKLSDFVCLGVVDQQPAGLLVRMDSPYKTWNNVAAAATKERVSVAFDGYGSSGDLVVNYLNRKLGAKFELVPYDKPGERIASVLGGHNDLLFTQPGDVVTYINGKQLRPILMFGNEKGAAFADVPISKQFGLTDASLIHFRVMYVKAGTPPEIVARLKDAVARAAASSGFKAALARESALPDSAVPAEKADAFIQGWLEEARRIKEAK